MTVWAEIGAVVVGVPDEGCDALLPVAVARAREQGVPIDLVRVWRDVDWLLSAPATAAKELAAREDDDRLLLTRAAEQLLHRAPDVAVIADFVPGDLYTKLLDRTRGASVLVIGDDRQLDGSITAWYLEHAYCPVLVVDRKGRVVTESPVATSLSKYGPHEG